VAEPTISVIIPCYNHGKYIRETVNSVLNQTFTDYEIIIVDDGSNDLETLSELDRIGKENPKIKIIHQKNGHLSNARNNGIRIAQGEFFLPLDSDDVIEPTMLEECYAKISKNSKIGFVYTYTHFFGDFDLVWKNQEYNFYDILFNNHPTVCALVRKKAWEDVNGYDENMKDGYEDWDFWINIGKKGWFGKVLKKPLFRYRKHGKSMIDDARAKHDANIDYMSFKHAELYSKESLEKIRRKWKPLNKMIFMKVAREISTVRLKMVLAGVSDISEWKKHPFRTLGRCVPIRLKKALNKLIGKDFFDVSYFGKKL
jgi:glycosyltransferase involved in cell wall biosynthesis